MEMIEVIATAHFTDTRFGAVSRKQKLRLSLEAAEHLEELGLVQRVNPTSATANVPHSTAPQDVGGGESPVLSPAAPVLPRGIATLHEHKDGQSLPSTTVGDLHEALTFYTLATSSGGASTTPKSPKTSKANAGLKTKVPQSVTAFAASEAKIIPASGGTA